MYPQGPYFLFTSQDVGFLWTAANENIPDAEPSYEFPVDNVVTRYVKRGPGERLYGFQLKTLVHQWLADLAQGQQKPIEEPEKTLALAGFSESIKGAVVLEEEEA
jgi:hypothetical protein